MEILHEGRSARLWGWLTAPHPISHLEFAAIIWVTYVLSDLLRWVTL